MARGRFFRDDYFDIHDHNIRTDEVEAFIRGLRRHCRKGIILVMDRLAAHRSPGQAVGGSPIGGPSNWQRTDRRAKRLAARFGRSVIVERLPPYAPKLNPVEQVWGHSKYADPVNFIPDDVGHLAWEVTHSIEHTASDPRLLRAFFQHEKLVL